VGGVSFRAFVADRACPALLDANRRFVEAAVRASDLDGGALVDDRADVAGSTLRGPAIIAAGARVHDCYVGPYTSVGRDVTLEGVEIEHSIVMAGATIRHFEGRIEGSVIGRRCRIDRDFAVPRAVRLQLGPEARVLVS
jgi:glucose-1-phosphate thymidylyltransferase